MSVSINCRTRDINARRIVKHTSLRGNPTDYMSVIDITPDAEKLGPLAAFIYDRADGKYIGGMLLRGFLVRVEGAPGTQKIADMKAHGAEKYAKIAQCYDLDPNERAVIRGWLFPVFEPNTNATNYFNNEALKIQSVAPGGRVVINNEVFDL